MEEKIDKINEWFEKEIKNHTLLVSKKESYS